MSGFEIPEGYAVPLVDMDTKLLPEPTMDALGELFTPPPPTPPAPVIIPGLYEDREQTHNVQDIRALANATSNGLLWTYFRARHTRTRTKVVALGGSNASAGVSSSSIGVYSVNPATWDLTGLLARVDDPTLFTVASSRWERTMNTPVDFVAGDWYAVAFRQTATTIGNRQAISIPAFSLQDTFIPPLGGFLPGYLDLPASVAGSLVYDNVNETSVFIYAEFLD